MVSQGFSMNDLYCEAQCRWLKPAEVLYILQNHENCHISQQPQRCPPGGSLFLFNKRVLRSFRSDGHSWRKKKHHKTIAEAHERLKVGNVEALNCYYAHGEHNPNFQRRSYWMLDPEFEHIVLVHYRDINEGRSSSGSIVSSSAVSPIPSPSPCSTQYPGFTSLTSEVNEYYQSLSSPSSVEVSSNNVMDHLANAYVEDLSNSHTQVSTALKRIEKQLSLNDDPIKEFNQFSLEDEQLNSTEFLDYETELPTEVRYGNIVDRSGNSTNYQFPDECNFMRDNGTNYVEFQDFDGSSEHAVGDEELWKEMLESYTKPLSANWSKPQDMQGGQWSNCSNNDKSIECAKIPAHPIVELRETSLGDYLPLFSQILPETPPESSSLILAPLQKYTIKEISPQWGYSNESTKVMIVGSFLCDPFKFSWNCMFDDIEVPIKIVQEGVLCCETPLHLPGKVQLCITSGNRQACSEIREFEYRDKSSICTQCKSSPLEEAHGSMEELLLLVRFVQMLLSDSPIQQGDACLSEVSLPQNSESSEDSCSHIIEALLDGSGTSSGTINGLLEVLLMDKLHQWLAIRSKGNDQVTCSLSRKEQGIIHTVAALGFEWALNPILSRGINVNFRDINGWTALHWAARFGREKIVAALVASGAFAGAVTDPSSHDPIGRTAASIAASNGHDGLAGYLSEVEVTSHLSSLVLEVNELSAVSAEVEAERTINSVTRDHLSINEDQLLMKNTLTAVRNVSQAAARIQAAFRAHSFRKRQQKESAMRIHNDYGISFDEIQAMSRLSSWSTGDRNSAALSIQKKYRGWKDRKDFLTLRQKVVKIQAYVRGYQVRKQYKLICWAVGVLDKVILRWRRKGAGLRSLRQERQMTEACEEDDDDILRGFRKQKVDGPIQEAVSRVRFMVDSPDARQQYSRMLDRYLQAKSELHGSTGEAGLLNSSYSPNMITEDEGYAHHFP